MNMQSNNVADIEDQLQKLRSSLQKIRSDSYNKALASFEAAGGCNRCRGRGWCVTWDTMDSMTGCYHESSSCDAEGCTSETRAASGLHPQNNKYDNFHNNSKWSPSRSPEIEVEISLTDRSIRDLECKLSLEKEKWSVSKGTVCKVVRPSKGPKNRRVPVGIIGFVKHIHTNNWGGQKCILIDDKGQQWWPKIEQVDVIDPDPDMEVWNKLDQEDREKTGYPVVVTVKRKSAKAVLIKTTRGTEFWVPLSQVPELKKFRQGSVASISMPMWLAKKNDLCG